MLAGINGKEKLLKMVGNLPRRFGRPPTSTAYVPQIDGLRAFAILSVLLWHTSLRADRFIDSTNGTMAGTMKVCGYGCKITDLYAWFPHGEIGVDFFFAISGFVIAQPFLSKPQIRWDIRGFYLRRLRRIYPPYLIALTVCLLLVCMSRYHHAGGFGSVLYSYLASIFYLHGLIYNQSSPLNPPLWSLEVEAQFYLLAPAILALYLLPRRIGTRLLVGGVTMAAMICLASVVDAKLQFDGRFRFGLLAHIYLFFAGILIADFFHLYKPLSKPATPAFDLIFALGIVGMYLCGLWLTHVDTKSGGGLKDIASDVAMLASIAAMFFGAMCGRLGRTITSHPLLCLIGAMCFSIYLIHIVVVQSVASMVLDHLPLREVGVIYPVFIVLPTVAALAFGFIFFVCVERPFMTGYRSSAPAAKHFVREPGRVEG